MTRDYVFDQAFDQERQRLSGMESLWDPGTRALLTDLGVGSGWRCLEIGAGGGSMVRWMADRGASVLAVDIDTRFVAPLASDAIEVRRLDVRTDDLPAAEFDLVHARLVMEHLSDRELILQRLAATLRPGGWMVIEDYDWTGFGWEGDEPLLDRLTVAIIGYMQRAGFDPRYGRRVVGDLEAVGLSELRGEARARVIASADPGFDFFRLSIESLRDPLVAAGVLPPAAADAAVARLDSGVRLLTPLMVAGIGRRA